MLGPFKHSLHLLRVLFHFLGNMLVTESSYTVFARLNSFLELIGVLDQHILLTPLSVVVMSATAMPISSIMPFTSMPVSSIVTSTALPALLMPLLFLLLFDHAV